MQHWVLPVVYNGFIAPWTVPVDVHVLECRRYSEKGRVKGCKLWERQIGKPRCHKIYPWVGMWKVSSPSRKHAGPHTIHASFQYSGHEFIHCHFCSLGPRFSIIMVTCCMLVLFMCRSFTIGRSGFFCPCIVTTAKEAGQGLQDRILPGALLPFPMRFLTTVPTGPTIANVVQIFCMPFSLKLRACRSRCMHIRGIAFNFT